MLLKMQPSLHFCHAVITNCRRLKSTALGYPQMVIGSKAEIPKG
jgi:hypothetical protein